MFKRFMQSRTVVAMLGFLIAAYMALVKYTTRWEVLGLENAAPLMGNGQGLIAATWHSRFLMLNSAWKRGYQMPYVLISRSRDGEVVSRTSQFLGLKTIRGSAQRAGKKSGKGGETAFRLMQKAITDGGCVVVTPDGPKGPRQRVGDGPFLLAKHSGAPLISCIFSTRFRKQLNSWDRFILPLPFGRGQIIWGEAVHVPSDATEVDIAAIAAAFEDQMNENLARADSAMGHALILPEDPLPRKPNARSAA